MNPPIIIIGGGGHARVLAEVLMRREENILGFTDPDASATLFEGIPHLGSDKTILDHRPEDILLINGLGSVSDNSARQALFATFTTKAYRFATLTHPDAILSSMDLQIGQGCQILAGTVIGPGAHLKDNVLINSRAVVEHDCQIGSHTHVSPGAIICGNCHIEEAAYIGAGAVVIQGVTIGAGAVIAAGAVVIHDVPANTLMAGVPARKKRSLNISLNNRNSDQ